jgi:hypothetical protein
MREKLRHISMYTLHGMSLIRDLNHPASLKTILKNSRRVRRQRIEQTFNNYHSTKFNDTKKKQFRGQALKSSTTN